MEITTKVMSPNLGCLPTTPSEADVSSLVSEAEHFRHQVIIVFLVYRWQVYSSLAKQCLVYDDI